METSIVRNKEIDCIKGLAIILVVWGHASIPFISLAYIINYFHMAVFFYVGGLLFQRENARNPSAYIYKKMKTTWFRAMKYILAFLLFYNLFLKLNIYSDVSGVDNIVPKYYMSFYEVVYSMLQALLNTTYYSELAGALWFVYPYIVCSILVCILFYFFEKNTISRWCVAVVCGGIGLFMTCNKFQLPWRVELSFLMVPIFVLGYEMKNVRISAWWLLPLAGVLIASYVCFQLEISFAAGIITVPWLFYPATIAGIVFLVVLGQKIVKIPYVNTALCLFGRQSFSIMALHFLSFKLVNLIDVIVNHKESYCIAQFPTSNYSWWYVYLAVGLIVPVVFEKTKESIVLWLRQRNLKNVLSQPPRS